MDNRGLNENFIPVVFCNAFEYNKTIRQGEIYMKKILTALVIMVTTIGFASAYQVISSRELGKNDAKNQNVVVKCTTPAGKISNQTCSLRRYAKCTGNGANKKCTGWQPWKDLRAPSQQYSDWKSAASACCRAKGLR